MNYIDIYNKVKKINFPNDPRILYGLIAVAMFLVGLLVGAKFFSIETKPPLNVAVVQEAKVTALAPTVVLKSLTATVGKKDTLAKILQRNGLNVKDAQAILALKPAAVLKELPVGKKIVLNIENPQTDKKLKQLVYVIDDLNTLTVVLRDNRWQAEIKTIKPTVKLSYAAATIDGSLYTAANKRGISYAVATQLASMFSNKADFRKMQRGDHFAVLYKEYTVNGKKIRKDEVVAAELTHKKKTHRMVGFADHSGDINYYTPEGYNNKPPFMRYPLIYKRIGSRFSSKRFHPILSVVRPHWGVDFVAPLGTPVKATSNGKIAFAGFRNGHGRTVVIKNGIYKTLYAHLSSFADNIRPGSYVKQGQIIGYVGKSGLATGPHLHYEFLLNGVHHDPLEVKLPDGEMIAPKHRKQFFAWSKKMLAQLDLYGKQDRIFAMNKVGEKNS